MNESYRNMNNKGKKGKESKDFAVTTEELKKLLEETDGKNQVIVAGLGYCGMRESELIHLRPSWIHVNDSKSEYYGQNHIKIPWKNGVKCTCTDCMLREYYRLRKQEEQDKQTRKYSWYMEAQADFYKLKENGELVDLELNPIWKPKSKAGARRIPLIDATAEQVIVDFYDSNKSIDLDRMQVWTRVQKMGIKILEKPLFPHALRATFGTLLAEKGISSGSLKKIMGWANLATADSYIESDSRQMFKEMKAIHNVPIHKIKSI